MFVDAYEEEDPAGVVGRAGPTNIAAPSKTSVIENAVIHIAMPDGKALTLLAKPDERIRDLMRQALTALAFWQMLQPSEP